MWTSLGQFCSLLFLFFRLSTYLILLHQRHEMIMFPLLIFITLFRVVRTQQECYYGPNATHRGSSDLVPCSNNGQSSCCLLGDVCLAGGACWNEATGDTYQYGCTDITYTDASCPSKCGWDLGESFAILSKSAKMLTIQIDHPGSLLNSAKTSVEFQTPGFVSHQRLVAVTGIGVWTCKFSRRRAVKQWEVWRA